MIKSTELYDKVRIEYNYNFLNIMIDKYMSIKYSDMSNELRKVSNLLYNQINYYAKDKNFDFNKEDLNSLLREINYDFINAGKPFDPSLHNGITNPLGVMTGWNTFKSWDLIGTEKISSKDMAHRFYIGISNDKMYELAHLLYKEFKTANIPFYFKTEISKEIQRTDNIVIYTSTKYLEQTLNVLDYISNSRPDLMAKCSPTSILAGKLTDKIGYASENPQASDSYTSMMCSSFIDAVNDSLIIYLQNNPNRNLINQYKQKIDYLTKNGKNLSRPDVRNRIFFDILLNNEPNFKKILFNNYGQKLQALNIDLNNICFNKDVKKQIEDITNFTTQNQVITEEVEITNLEDLAIAIQRLNPNAKIMLGNPVLVSDFDSKIFSSIPLGSLTLPKGFYFKENTITNKHSNQNANYLNIDVDGINQSNLSLLVELKDKSKKEFKWESQKEKQAYVTKTIENQEYLLEHPLEQSNQNGLNSLELNNKSRVLKMEQIQYKRNNGFITIGIVISLILSGISAIALITFYLITR